MEEQATGVTQDIINSLDSAPDSTPESIDTGNAQESEVIDPVQAEGVEPQAGSKEYNFKQMRENLSRLETERKQWLEERKGLTGAADLDKWIRSDPKNLEFIIGLRNGRNPKDLAAQIYAEKVQEQAEAGFNFEQYDPDTGKLLKTYHDKLNGLEQWKTQLEQTIQQQQKQDEQTQIDRNMQAINDDFDNQLIKDGYVDANGKGDDSVVELIRHAVIAKLAQSTDDPRTASKAQFTEAYKAVVNGLSAYQKQTLKKAVKTDVPLSGSRKGSIPIGKTTMTEDERISSIVNSL